MTGPEEEFELEEFEPEDDLDPDERDFEASAEDTVEQATPADPAEEPVEVHRGLEVDEFDAIEQAQPVDGSIDGSEE
jgi:hypothetical protein